MKEENDLGLWEKGTFDILWNHYKNSFAFIAKDGGQVGHAKVFDIYGIKKNLSEDPIFSFKNPIRIYISEDMSEINRAELLKEAK